MTSTKRALPPQLSEGPIGNTTYLKSIGNIYFSCAHRFSYWFNFLRNCSYSYSSRGGGVFIRIGPVTLLCILHERSVAFCCKC